jgi:Hemerythrin HHE cation binding domain
MGKRQPGATPPAHGGPSAEAGGPLIVARRAHDEILGLCGELEAIADDLPARVDQLRCLGVASRLLALLRACHALEESAVFPAFETPKNRPVVERLRREHIEDQCGAQEVCEALLDVAERGTVVNAEALGYMLRAFFAGMRRHVAFERDHVLPLLRIGD